jgi:hypothetical protein
MFIGWSSTRFVFLVLIWNPTWLPESIMCSHWLKFKKIFLSETTKPIELWLCNFESCPSKDHSCHVCFKLTYWFQRRRLLNIFSIGSYVKTKLSHGGHLEFFTFKSSSLKPLNRFQPNWPEMFIGWSSTRFVFLVLIW